MSEKVKSAWPHLVFKICVFAALIITCAYLIIYGLDTTREYHFGYKEHGDIDYSVRLKSGNFLSEDSIAAGETYYSDSIDAIDATFKYGATFTDSVTGEYEYYLYATVVANEDNGDKLWSNTVQITEATTKNLKNSKKLAIKTQELIYYHEYDQIMQRFAEEYGTSAGTLKIFLAVRGNFTTEVMDRPVKLNSNISLDMPLAKKAVTISVSTDTDNDGKIYTKKVNIDDDRHHYCRFVGMMMIFAILYLAYALIRNRHRDRKEHAYEYTVKKYREEYDNIIVDLTTAPKLTHLHVARVQTFGELLDVYNSIKQPINYYEAKDGAHFLLVNGRLAWQYVVPKLTRKRRVLKKTAPKRRAVRRRK